MKLIIKVKGHQHQWLAGGYDLKIAYFRGGQLVDSGFFAQCVRTSIHATLVLLRACMHYVSV